jgi:FlaA1/EpsC-like NDP-sugar epimerase
MVEFITKGWHNEPMEENPWLGKRVMITGACGTVGTELLLQLANCSPAEIIGLDHNESELFFLLEEYRDQPNIHFVLGDIRDRDKLERAMRGVDIVLHTAAYKHVILCEQSPHDAVQTNILGTQNVIDAASVNKVKRVIFTSSDKAVNPTNVMGTSKLMGERLMTAANAFRRNGGPIFSSTRFGNVLGSRGSVIPLFKRQIAQGGPVTLTDDCMTRFTMTIQQAAHLVMESVFLARGGEVFITKMPAVRILDLAHVMIEELAPAYGYSPARIQIVTIGGKPGEKLYEELMNEEETRRALELHDYFVVMPAFKSVYEIIQYQYPGMLGEAPLDDPYNSSMVAPMSRDMLSDYLMKLRLLEKEDF